MAPENRFLMNPAKLGPNFALKTNEVMVVWQSAEGEATDIQRLDIWSPHQGLSLPLSHVLASLSLCVCGFCVCVYMCQRGYTPEEYL